MLPKLPAQGLFPTKKTPHLIYGGWLVPKCFIVIVSFLENIYVDTIVIFLL